MKKLEIFSVFAVIFLLTLSIVSYSETGQECASKCFEACSGGGTVKDDDMYKDCLKGGCFHTPIGIPEARRLTLSIPSQEKWEISENNTSQIVAQNENYIACYKRVDTKNVLLRWCPTGKPWTPTNEHRNFCYATSEACARAEMPQSWCIKCGVSD